MGEIGSYIFVHIGFRAGMGESSGEYGYSDIEDVLSVFRVGMTADELIRSWCWSLGSNGARVGFEVGGGNVIL